MNDLPLINQSWGEKIANIIHNVHLNTTGQNLDKFLISKTIFNTKPVMNFWSENRRLFP